MFKNLMNRYYYGKSGQGDYEKEDLPRTRLQLFWEMLRNRAGALMRLNLMYAVVWLPAMFVIFRMVTSIFTLLAAVEDPTLLQSEAVTATAADIPSMFHSTIFYSLLFLVPCIAITGPFTAGLCYVTRNWARDEHAFVWTDYKDAIKANWKPALLTSTITGFVPILVYVAYTYYGQLASQSILFLVLQALVVMVGIIWMMMQLYTYPQMVTYTLKYKDVLRNSLIMTIGRLPQSVLFRLITVVPFVLFFGVGLFLAASYFHVVLLLYGAYYILIGYALSRFITASYTNSLFDKFINPNIEGAEVNRGLYQPDEFDKEEAEDEDAEA